MENGNPLPTNYYHFEIKRPRNDRAAGRGCGGDNFGIDAEFQGGLGSEDQQGSLTEFLGNTEPKSQGGQAKFIEY